MVPIDRAAFRDGLSADPVVRAFASFLLEGVAPQAHLPGLSARGRITIDALRALALDQREPFERAYAEIQGRRISEEADWVYDDYLLFVLCAGARRYGAAPEFLRQVLEQRRKVQGATEDRGLIEEFVKLLERDNRFAQSPVLVVGRFLAADLGHATGDMTAVYRTAVKSLAQPDTSEFIRIISAKAVDLVIECLPISTAVPSVFWRYFERRTRQLATAVHIGFCIVALGVWGYLGAYYLFGSGTRADIAEKLFSMSLVIAPSAVLLARKKVIFGTQRLLIRFWGGSELAEKYKSPAE